MHSRYPQCLVISNPRESSVEFRRELRCRRAWLFGVFVNSCDLACWQYWWYVVSCFGLVKPLFWQPKQSVSGPHLDYFASPLWLFCLVTLTILRPHFDYLAFSPCLSCCPSTERRQSQMLKRRYEMLISRLPFVRIFHIPAGFLRPACSLCAIFFGVFWKAEPLY